MSDGLVNATELRSNALAIVSAMSHITYAFNIPPNFNTKMTRRTLEARDANDIVGHGVDGFPMSMPMRDRKLL